MTPAPALAAQKPPLRYAGATTLQRYFMPEAARAFEAATGIPCSYVGGNTDAGIKALLNRQVDIAGAGRHLTPAERAAGLQEHQLGWDILVGIVHPANPVHNLTPGQLRDLFSGRIRNWKEVGGRDLPILPIVPPQGSGVRTALEELVLQGAPLANNAITSLIVADVDAQVTQWPSAIGFISLSMVETEIKKLRLDGIDPASDAAATDSYPLKKPIALITRGTPSDAVKRFVAFARGQDGQRLLKKHFIPLPAQ